MQWPRGAFGFATPAGREPSRAAVLRRRTIVVRDELAPQTEAEPAAHRSCVSRTRTPIATAAVLGTDPARTSNGNPPQPTPEDLAATLGPAAGPGQQTALPWLANSRPAASLRQRRPVWRPALAFRSRRRQSDLHATRDIRYGWLMIMASLRWWACVTGRSVWLGRGEARLRWAVRNGKPACGICQGRGSPRPDQAGQAT